MRLVRQERLEQPALAVLLAQRVLREQQDRPEWDSQGLKVLRVLVVHKGRQVPQELQDLGLLVLKVLQE